MNTASKPGPYKQTPGTNTPDLGCAIALVGEGGMHKNKANAGVFDEGAN
jgi:hypothetical protein